VSRKTLQYTGERLVPEDEHLQLLLVEDLAKFHFIEKYARGQRVLDAGCGAGQGTTHLAGHGATHVVGVDIAPEAVAFARSRSTLQNLAFGAMDVAQLGFCDGTFDLVTSIEVIEHLINPEQYVAEIRRVLKRDGRLVLSTPNKLITSPRPGMMWPYHIHEFYPDELYGLLSRYFSQVERWGMCIPVYEQHPARKLVHRLAPVFKPLLPHKLRTGFLPWLQGRIKSDLTVDEVQFSQAAVEEMPTLVAVCRA
jgi:ubiquinone/menaquinone biosynthesis C-methylase UbiE